MLNDKTILITGGTGSFGKKCTETILKKYKPKKLIIFSRDELKQFEMSQIFNIDEYPCIRYFIGDVRDKERLHRAFLGVDYIIHAAAMKQVPASEYNPFEAVLTNIIGAQNIINEAIDNDVKKVIAISTDKAVNPINLYGATKLCSEKLFIDGNSYSQINKTIFSVVRYGNVIGSRGSVIPFFINKKQSHKLPITDINMTRFWITIEDAVDLVINRLCDMNGGEIFVPKIPSMKISDLADVICPECEIEVVGIRPGEKLHEVLISKDESINTIELTNFYIIKSRFMQNSDYNGTLVANNFEYTSNNNSKWITKNALKDFIKESTK